MPASDLRGEEIIALLAEVRERVRTRYANAGPNSDPGQPFRVPIADLMPLIHARDAAQAKMASIGSVNPRPGGPLNQAIQIIKRAISRSLGWFVRDQITFNRQLMAYVEASMEALTEVNSALSLLGGQINLQSARLGGKDAGLAGQVHVLEGQAARLDDLVQNWQAWRKQWEASLASNEVQFLRTVADLQMGFSHRATMMESSFRESVKQQHAEYKGALDGARLEIQARMWADLQKIRDEYERVIHNELRVIRMRLQAQSAAASSQPTPVPDPTEQLHFDYSRFADRFRGSEEYVRANQQFYVPFLRDVGRVLDLGCGRGELLDVLREHGISARGIELSDEHVNYCRSKGLDVEKADLFTFLEALPEASEDSIVSAQVVEHLDPASLPDLIRLCASRLRKGGVLAVETPNPECLAIFASHFYLDPTHTRPVPSALLAFYMEEAGFGRIEVHRLSPAQESFPEIGELPPGFAARFFGGLDYAIIGRKIGN